MNATKFTIFSCTLIYILQTLPIMGNKLPGILSIANYVLLFLVLVFNIGTKSLSKILPIFLIPFLDVLIRGNNMLELFRGIASFLYSLVLPMLGIYLLKKNNFKMAVIIFGTFVLTNIITCYTTYFGCQIYPNAARDLATGDIMESPFYQIYLDANIGGFKFIYNLVLFSILTICLIKNNKQLSINLILIIVSITFFLGIVLAITASQYTIAILLTSINLLLFFIGRKLSARKVILLGGTLLLILVAFKPVVADGLMKIADNIESKTVSHRLTDISLSLEGKHSQEDSNMDSRKEKYMKSINNFINNPLGGWSLQSAGGHSYIFDTLAKYGILGLILLIISLKKIYRNYIKPLYGSFVYGYALMLFLQLIILAILNPILFTDFMLFVLPIYCFIFVNDNQLIKHKNKYNEN